MEQRTVPTPRGDAHLHTRRARRPVARLLLQHGAGGGIEAADLQALATGLPRNGVTVTLVEQPWRVAGKRVAGPPASLDEAIGAVVRSLRGDLPLVLGGRSAGARSAARTARALGAAGCLALAFPLHPPGRPEKSRADELARAGVPTLVVQGERDPFGRPDEFPEDLPGVDMAVVPDADHAFAVGKRSGLTADEVEDVLVESVLEWATREVTG